MPPVSFVFRPYMEMPISFHCPILSFPFFIHGYVLSYPWSIPVASLSVFFFSLYPLRSFPSLCPFKAFVSLLMPLFISFVPHPFISLTLPSLASISPDLSLFSRSWMSVTQTRHRPLCCLGDQREQSPEEEEPDADAAHPRAA